MFPMRTRSLPRLSRQDVMRSCRLQISSGEIDTVWFEIPLDSTGGSPRTSKIPRRRKSMNAKPSFSAVGEKWGNRATTPFFLQHSLLLQFLIDHVEVSAGTAAAALQVVILELFRKLQIRHRLFSGFAGRKGCTGVLQEQAVEFAVIDKVLPRQRTGCSVAGDHLINVLDVRGGFSNRVGVSDTASAIGKIDQRLAFCSEHISRMHGAHCRKDDNRIATSVSGSKIVKVNLVASL